MRPCVGIKPRREYFARNWLSVSLESLGSASGDRIYQWLKQRLYQHLLHLFYETFSTHIGGYSRCSNERCGARTGCLPTYQAALRLMQEGKYDKAHAAFNKMLEAGAGDLADRIRMYINACLMQVSKGKDQLQEQ